MKDNYDFSKGIKNPYAEKLKQGYTVTVHYDFADENACKEDRHDKESDDSGLPKKQA